MSINGAMNLAGGLSDPDIEMSHGLLNHLNSGYQGKFAFLNILLQLECPFDSGTVVEDTRKTLGSINKWLKDLWEGGAILNHLWDEPRTFEAKQAMEMVSLLREELLGLANDIVDSLANETFRQDRAESIFLIAAYGWNAYSRDNFTRCFVDYGKKFDDRVILDNFEPMLDEAEERVQYTHELMKQFKASETLTEEFCDALFRAAMTLPGTLYCLAHELNQLAYRFEREFTFEMALIPEEEAELWKMLGITPEYAGYWRAHGIFPYEADSWRAQGMYDYATAATWKIWGFEPQIAREWASYGFTPAACMIWIQNEFPPEKACHFVERGMMHPSEIPEYMLY
jgi:hypothetical protein